MSESPLLKALKEHNVSTKVEDCDHYRIQGGLAVESDYIISVRQEPESGKAAAATDNNKKGAEPSITGFECFYISKTYSAFRSFVHQLRKVARATKKQSKISHEEMELIGYCELVYSQVDAQNTTYLGKVNYMYVKVLAKQRKQIIEDVLAATCRSFPTSPDSSLIASQVSSIIETFLLTDHVVVSDDSSISEMRGQRSSSGKNHHNSSTLDNLNPLTWVKSSSSKGKGHKKGATTSSLSVDTQTTTKTHRLSTVVPITRRSRKTNDQREIEEKELETVGESARLLVDDDRGGQRTLPNYSRPVPVVQSSKTAVGRFLETNPMAFVGIAVLALFVLQKASKVVVSMDSDIGLLVAFACYCLGLHTPRSVDLPVMEGTAAITTTASLSSKADRSGRKLLRHSMAVTSPAVRNRASMAARASVAASGMLQASQKVASMVNEEGEFLDDISEHEEEDEDVGTLGSPLPVFPKGARLGSHFNCWSCPDPSDFHVRGPNYLVDKKKIKSGDYLLPTRGLDLFLTDICPTNVGRNPGLFGGGGKLREKPTLVINYILPWGVLLFYSEIPKKFVPFIEARNDTEKDKLIPQLKDMSPAERTVARWFMGDSKEKDKTLKIVPVVIDGPWVVKSVVGGKPSLIGEKLPINYIYQPAEGDKALYLELDMDIAASSAARGILSVTRSYTSVLTLNLGFVIQGNASDELPEQMIMGARLHGIDPCSAASYPADSEFDMLSIRTVSSDEDSV